MDKQVDSSGTNPPCIVRLKGAFCLTVLSNLREFTISCNSCAILPFVVFIRPVTKRDSKVLVSTVRPSVCLYIPLQDCKNQPSTPKKA